MFVIDLFCKGCTITVEGEFTGPQIDAHKLIDQVIAIDIYTSTYNPFLIVHSSKLFSFGSA